jgi:exopolysaccharide production protein ExoZ
MLAAFLVLFGHLAVIDTKYSVDPVMPDWSLAGMAGVDLFFAISGFIMAVIAGAAPRSPASAAKFLLSRAGRIYPLYWVVAGAVTALWLYAPHMVFASDPTPPDHLKSFLLWPDDRLPLLQVAWTLVHEMYFYLVFALILLLPRVLAVPLLMMWGSVVAAGVYLGWGAVGPEARLAVHPLTFEFIAGALAGFAFTASRGALGMAALLLGAASFGGAVAWVITSGLYADGVFWTESWLRPALFAVPSALFVYGLASLDAKGRHASRFLQGLGDQSYALYLTHVLTLSAAGRVWAMLPQRDGVWWDNALALAALTIAAYIAAEIAYRLIDRPAHRAVQALRRSMDGGKPAPQAHAVAP